MNEDLKFLTSSIINTENLTPKPTTAFCSKIYNVANPDNNINPPLPNLGQKGAEIALGNLSMNLTGNFQNVLLSGAVPINMNSETLSGSNFNPGTLLFQLNIYRDSTSSKSIFSQQQTIFFLMSTGNFIPNMSSSIYFEFVDTIPNNTDISIPWQYYFKVCLISQDNFNITTLGDAYVAKNFYITAQEFNHI